jgi:hypothetical protein
MGIWIWTKREWRFKRYVGSVDLYREVRALATWTPFSLVFSLDQDSVIQEASGTESTGLRSLGGVFCSCLRTSSAKVCGRKWLILTQTAVLHQPEEALGHT